MHFYHNMKIEKGIGAPGPKRWQYSLLWKTIFAYYTCSAKCCRKTIYIGRSIHKNCVHLIPTIGLLSHGQFSDSTLSFNT